MYFILLILHEGVTFSLDILKGDIITRESQDLKSRLTFRGIGSIMKISGCRHSWLGV
ncbi:MAG: hypothetical protein Ta2B_28030 [Termitinemataceae bacterium]|nr:MAG: hypothetical protein Ta2B_28030 [Termitinemataceae bacterium]